MQKIAQRPFSFLPVYRIYKQSDCQGLSFFLFRGRVAVCVGAVARSVGFFFVCGAIGGRGGRFNVFESFDEGIHFSVSGKQGNFADGQICFDKEFFGLLHSFDQDIFQR